MNAQQSPPQPECEASLRQCPCGQTPTALVVEAEGERPKWARVYGNCCGQWLIEYRNGYAKLNTPDSDRIAMQAWNRAPRANAAFSGSGTTQQQNSEGLSA